MIQKQTEYGCEYDSRTSIHHHRITLPASLEIEKKIARDEKE